MDLMEEYFKLMEGIVKYLRLDGTTKVRKKHIFFTNGG